MDHKTFSNFCLRLFHGFRKTQKNRAITSAWKLEESSRDLPKKTSPQIYGYTVHVIPPNHLKPIRLATLGACFFFGQGTWLSPNQTNHSPHPTVQENQDNVALGAPESTEASNNQRLHRIARNEAQMILKLDLFLIICGWFLLVEDSENWGQVMKNEDWKWFLEWLSLENPK